MAFAALGVLAYGLLFAVRSAVPVTVASQPVSDLGLAIAAILLVQAGRVETPFKGSMPGLPEIAGSLESIYTKGLRLWMSEMFTSLVKGMPDDSGHQSLLRRSLASGYSFSELVLEFRGWCEGLQDPKKTEMLDWLSSVESAKKPGETGQRSSIAARLIQEDNKLCRELAANRSATIVQLRAWRN